MSAVGEQMQNLVLSMQATICAELTALDGAGHFGEDRWTRPDGGGGGVSRVLQGGRIFEKAGVNVSIVRGTLSPEAAKSMGGGQHLPHDQHLDFFACGISLIIHAHNPMVPTVHANYRYFERGGQKTQPAAWWFGGGADLTPAYLFDEDAEHFHRVHKQACDQHDLSYYPRFKKWCDNYFRIVHRNENRGVGGIFFDNLNDRDPAKLLAFVTQCAESLLPAYVPLVKARYQLPFTASQRHWQELRRGRYVEFNLVYDRGTTFGLKTGGRIESILVSLPATARWDYMAPEPEPGSDEARLLAVTRVPKEWL